MHVLQLITTNAASTQDATLMNTRTQREQEHIVRQFVTLCVRFFSVSVFPLGILRVSFMRSTIYMFAVHAVRSTLQYVSVMRARKELIDFSH